MRTFNARFAVHQLVNVAGESPLDYRCVARNSRERELPEVPAITFPPGIAAHIASSSVSIDSTKLETMVHLALGCIRPIGKRRIPYEAFHFHRSRQVYGRH